MVTAITEPGPALASMRQAIVMTGHTAAELRRLVDVRRSRVEKHGKAARDDIPEPIAYTGRGDPSVWDHRDLQLWAWRMGVHTRGYHGTPVIGYAGIAVLVGWDEGTPRHCTWLRNKHIRAEGQARADDIPEPLVTIDDAGIWPVVLFDRAAVMRWLVLSRRLAPDGRPMKR